MMTKFNIGDKVRVLDVNFIDSPRVIRSSDIFEVKHVTNIGGLRMNRLSDGAYLYFATDELRYVEKVEAKPSKSERISLLESQVAELQAEVQALQKRRKPATVLVHSPNEQRKAVIERAKAFVAEHLSINDEVLVSKKHRKITVVVGAWSSFPVKLARVGVSKCAPDDVFNADIGKAIALGRALGRDVSEFENAPKPTEVVEGMVVDTYIDGDFFKTVKPVKVIGDCMYANFVTAEYTPYEPGDKIIDDTEAQY